MNQERLSDLAIVAYETNFGELIDYFAEKKALHVQFRLEKNAGLKRCVLSHLPVASTDSMFLTFNFDT